MARRALRVAGAGRAAVQGLGRYPRSLDIARAAARAQGCRGAQWPKQVGPDSFQARYAAVVTPHGHLIEVAVDVVNMWNELPETDLAEQRRALDGPER
mgnify:CR=1 FL=1